jgi:hypothetical protein
MVQEPLVVIKGLRLETEGDLGSCCKEVHIDTLQLFKGHPFFIAGIPGKARVLCVARSTFCSVSMAGAWECTLRSPSSRIRMLADHEAQFASTAYRYSRLSA